MEETFKKLLKTLKTNEEVISQALGALVVVLVGVMLFNRFKDNQPQPELTPEAEQTIATNQEVEFTTDEEGKYIPKNLPTTHTVVKGEHLWMISEKYYGNGYNWVDIAKANNLAAPYSLESGMELTIPKAALRYDKEVMAMKENDTQITQEPQATTEEAVKVTTDSKGAESLLEAATYTVVKGDYLWSIALRAYGDGYKWTDIYNANKEKISNPNYIEIGMELTLPR